MRPSSVLLLLCAVVVLTLSSCTASNRFAGGDWEPATDSPRHGRPDRPLTRVAILPPLHPAALDVGGSELRYPAPTPLATRTVPVRDVPPPFRPAPPSSYIVAPGETLTAIARNELGDASRWRDIVAANPGLDPSHIQAGQKLKMPR